MEKNDVRNLDWNDLVKVMLAPARSINNKCHVLAATQIENRTFKPRLKGGERGHDEAICVTGLKKMFAGCCVAPHGNLQKRVDELEFKIKRLEKLYCKKLKGMRIEGPPSSPPTSPPPKAKAPGSGTSVASSPAAQKKPGTPKKGNVFIQSQEDMKGNINRHVFADSEASIPAKKKEPATTPSNKVSDQSKESNRSKGKLQRGVFADSDTSSHGKHKEPVFVNSNTSTPAKKKGPVTTPSNTSIPAKKKEPATTPSNTSIAAKKKEPATTPSNTSIPAKKKETVVTARPDAFSRRKKTKGGSDPSTVSTPSKGHLARPVFVDSDTSGSGRPKGGVFSGSNTSTQSKPKEPVVVVTTSPETSTPSKERGVSPFKKGGGPTILGFVGFDSVESSEVFSEDSLKLYSDNSYYFTTSISSVPECETLPKREALLQKINIDYPNVPTNLSQSYVEYTSILRQPREADPIAANIATFNKNHNIYLASHNPVKCDKPESIEYNYCWNENDPEELFIKQPLKNNFIQRYGYRKAKLEDKTVDSMVQCNVEQVDRSVSSCRLPIDINLCLKSPSSESDVCVIVRDPYSKRNKRENKPVAAVCFDSPSSPSSNLNVKFHSTGYKRPNSY